MKGNFFKSDRPGEHWNFSNGYNFDFDIQPLEEKKKRGRPIIEAGNNNNIVNLIPRDPFLFYTLWSETDRPKKEPLRVRATLVEQAVTPKSYFR